jgi:hypothetical integral membrane protein (TIGR02206 family)
LSPARQFTAYGPSHWGVLALFGIGAVLLVWIGRKQTERESRRLGRILGAVTALIYAAILIYILTPPTLESSVPLQLTDLATVAAAYALWSQKQWAYALTYYWGLVLSTLAFWAIHLLVVWAAIYLTWGCGMRPDWRSYRLAVVVTVVWAAGTYMFNRLAGTNYGFLNHKPSTASLLDVLGPWPWYVFIAATLVSIVWALMTWPWARLRRSR